MSKKTVKNLDVELSKLKEEFVEVKRNLETLLKKYEDIEKKCTRSENFQCDVCDEIFARKSIMLKHKRCHKSVLPGQFDCSECEKTFQEKWKLDAHVKVHEKFACEKCEKKFNSKDIKEKHVKIAHEGLKFYCCFYNNEEECPYQHECVSLHEVSPSCRYGDSC